MRVSIAMATCNGSRFLQQQLDSLAAQSRLPDQLVIVDDQSSDDTPAILEHFAMRAPFPVALHRNTERLGWRGNFFRALSLCDGDLIGFSDQDDIWHAEKIATCLTAFAGPSVLLAYHGAELIDRDGNRIGDLRSYQSQPDPLAPPLSAGPWKNMLGFSMMFRAELLRFSGYWPASRDWGALGEREGHDQWLSFLASTLGQVAYVDRELVRYRIHQSNAVGISAKGGTAGRWRRVLPQPLVQALTAHRQLVKLADAIEARIAILERIAADHADLADRIAPALERWQALRMQAQYRAELYADRDPVRRLARAHALRRERAAAPDAWVLPAPPGALADVLVRTLSGLSPMLAGKLMSSQSDLGTPIAAQTIKGLRLK